MIKAEHRSDAVAAVREAVEGSPPAAGCGVSVSVDVDPQ